MNKCLLKAIFKFNKKRFISKNNIDQTGKDWDQFPDTAVRIAKEKDKQHAFFLEKFKIT